MARNSLRHTSHLINGGAYSIMISRRCGEGVHIVRSHPLRTTIVLDICQMGLDHPDVFKFLSKFSVLNGSEDTPAGSDPGPSTHQNSLSPYGKALCVLFLECSSLQKEELKEQFKKMFEGNEFDLAVFFGRNKCLNDLRTFFDELKFNALSKTYDGSIYATWRASISVHSWEVSWSAMVLKLRAPDFETCPQAADASSSTVGTDFIFRDYFCLSAANGHQNDSSSMCSPNPKRMKSVERWGAAKLIEMESVDTTLCLGSMRGTPDKRRPKSLIQPKPIKAPNPYLLPATSYDKKSKTGPPFLFLAVFKPIGGKSGAYAGVFTSMTNQWIQGFYGYVDETSGVALGLRGLHCGINAIIANDWKYTVIHSPRQDVLNVARRKFSSNPHSHLEDASQVGLMSRSNGCFITCILHDAHPMAAKLAHYCYEKRVTNAMLVHPPPDLNF